LWGCLLLSALRAACLHLHVWHHRPGRSVCISFCSSYCIPFPPYGHFERVGIVFENNVFYVCHGDLLLCTRLCTELNLMVEYIKKNTADWKYSGIVKCLVSCGFSAYWPTFSFLFSDDYSSPTLDVMVHSPVVWVDYPVN